jgi:hypothetical protein
MPKMSQDVALIVDYSYMKFSFSLSVTNKIGCANVQKKESVKYNYMNSSAEVTLLYRIA